MRTLQKVPQETLDRLGEDGLSITCWTHPHHGYGWIKNLLALNEENGVITVAFWQNFSVFPGRLKREEIDEAFEHVEYALDARCLTPLLDMIATTGLSWRPLQNAPRFLGGSHFGLRVAWAGIETERRWHGRLKDIDEVTSSLWEFVDNLVPTPIHFLQQ